MQAQHVAPHFCEPLSTVTQKGRAPPISSPHHNQQRTRTHEHTIMALSLFTGDPWFDRTLARDTEPIWGSWPTSTLATPRLTHPMDVIEHPTHIRIMADAPGMTPEDINIEIQDNMLVLSGQKSQKFEDTKRQAGVRTHVQERSFQSFSRTFPLPDNVNTEGIAARMENGVLTVDIPKVAQAEKKMPKRIQVAGGGGATPMIQGGAGGMMGGGAGTTTGMTGGMGAGGTTTGMGTTGMGGGTTTGMGGGTTTGMGGGTTTGMGMGGGTADVPGAGTPGAGI